MNAFLAQLLNGLDKGGAYALIALGLTLVFGTLGVVNFAHGALFMLGCFCAVAFRYLLTIETLTIDPDKLSQWGSPLEIRTPLVQHWLGDWGAVLVDYSVPISILFAIPVMLVIGIAMERGLIKHFYKRSHAEQILVTFGLAIVLQEIVKSFFGANPAPQPIPSDLHGAADVGVWIGMEAHQLTYLSWPLIYLVFSLVVIGGVFAFMRFTTFGMVVRAGMADRETVGLLGIDIDKRFTIIFGLAAVVAGNGITAGGGGGRVFAGHSAILCLDERSQINLPGNRPDHHLSRGHRHPAGSSAWPDGSYRRHGKLIRYVFTFTQGDHHARGFRRRRAEHADLAGSLWRGLSGADAEVCDLRDLCHRL